MKIDVDVDLRSLVGKLVSHNNMTLLVEEIVIEGPERVCVFVHGEAKGGGRFSWKLLSSDGKMVGDWDLK